MLLFADVPENPKYPDDLSVDHDRQVRDVHGKQFVTLVENPCLEALRFSFARCAKMLTDPFQVLFEYKMGKVMTNEIGCSVRF